MSAVLASGRSARIFSAAWKVSCDARLSWSLRPVHRRRGGWAGSVALLMPATVPDYGM